ncbi:unnamed protein product [Pieris macdunnoughi]|uniref:Uncharacterized protein n=1 Tax=Pieris macdunnoughi TaxID=345717 RepID=A0A821S3F3_9NEOP|nr:unnamed protein product [Pieris macdunnoughi]
MGGRYAPDPSQIAKPLPGIPKRKRGCPKQTWQRSVNAEAKERRGVKLRDPRTDQAGFNAECPQPHLEDKYIVTEFQVKCTSFLVIESTR